MQEHEDAKQQGKLSPAEIETHSKLINHLRSLHDARTSTTSLSNANSSCSTNKKVKDKLRHKTYD